MKDAPLSDADISARIAMVDHLDMQAQAMHGLFRPDYRKVGVSAAGVVGMGIAVVVILSWLA